MPVEDEVAAEQYRSYDPLTQYEAFYRRNRPIGVYASWDGIDCRKESHLDLCAWDWYNLKVTSASV